MNNKQSFQEQIDGLKEQNKRIINALTTLGEKMHVDLKLDIQPHSTPVTPIQPHKVEIPKTIEKSADITQTNDKQKSTSIEENIGTKWFGRIGIAALVIGVGYFIKFAIDNGLISHLTRIVLGIVFGAGLVVAGEIASKQEKYRMWGKTLVGGGLAIVYFVIYAAYHFTAYREAIGISQTLDTILLSVVAACTLLFSLKDDSQIVASEAFLLGFITPLLSNQINTMTLVYNLILSIVLTIVVVQKKWPLIGIGGLSLTYFTYFAWPFDKAANFATSIAFLLTYFLTYTAQIVMQSKENPDEKTETNNLVLHLLNAACFFPIGLYLVRKNFASYDSLFSLATALFYFALSYFSLVTQRIKIGITSLYLGILFTTITIPLYFHKEWVTIWWSLIALLLIISWSKFKSRVLLYSTHFVSALTLLKALAYDQYYPQAASISQFFTSTRVLTALFVALCFYGAYALLNKNKDILNSEEQVVLPFIYSAAASSLVVFITDLELSNHTYLISVIWSIFALLQIYTSFNTRFSELKYQGMILSAILATKIILFDSALPGINLVNITESTRLIAFLSGITLFNWATFYLHAIKEKLTENDITITKLYSWAATALSALLILLEIKDYWMSIGWALLGLMTMSIGFYQRRKELRYQGILLFGITVLKVFLYDTRELSTIYRTISFMVLGSLLLAASFIYAKYKDKLKEII